jgi:hypothetical protein
VEYPQVIVEEVVVADDGIAIPVDLDRRIHPNAGLGIRRANGIIRCAARVTTVNNAKREIVIVIGAYHGVPIGIQC